MRILLARVAFAAFALASTGVSAENAIGEMAEVRGSVTGTLRGVSGALNNGSRVVQNQTVSTGADSSGRVAFHDLTSLALGPNASVTLDKYVFNSEGTVNSSSLGLARGAFRIVSGRSPSQNIGVKTPTATIGLRGTVVDVLVQPGRELIILQQGAMTVCKGTQCVPVDLPGLGVIVSGAGVSLPSPQPMAEFKFDVLTQNRFQMFGPYSGSPGGDNPGDSSSSNSGSGGNTSGSGSTSGSGNTSGSGTSDGPGH